MHIYSCPIILPTTCPPTPRHGLARCSPRLRPRQWACSSGPVMKALIRPTRRRRFPSHAFDWRRSWSVTPGVRPAVTLVYSARHNGGSSRSANPRPCPRPQLRCPGLPPWQPHRTVGHQVLGGTGKHAPGWGRWRPRMGKTLPHIEQC